MFSEGVSRVPIPSRCRETPPQWLLNGRSSACRDLGREVVHQEEQLGRGKCTNMVIAWDVIDRLLHHGNSSGVEFRIAFTVGIEKIGNGLTIRADPEVGAVFCPMGIDKTGSTSIRCQGFCTTVHR